MKKPTITVREYAFRHKVLPQVVYQRLWAGKLTGTQENGRWLIDDPDVDEKNKKDGERKEVGAR